MDETEYHLKIQPLLELVSVETQLAFTISCIRRQLAVWYEFDSTDDCLEECLQLVERNKSDGIEFADLSSRLELAQTRAIEAYEKTDQINTFRTASKSGLIALKAKHIASAISELMLVLSPLEGVVMSHYLASALSLVWASTLFENRERIQQESELNKLLESQNRNF